MKRLIIYYSFILITILTILSFVLSRSFSEIISACIFFPLFIYFAPLFFYKEKNSFIKRLLRMFKKRKQLAIVKQDRSLEPSVEVETGTVLPSSFDINRRMLLKLVGSAGVGLFFMSVFTTKSHAAFFGSTPGQGTVGLKDSTGTPIDPAIKAPTDGYKISEVDDSGSPAYYGFIDKTGAWFIMKEDSSGAYRYAKGSSSFSSSWATRSILTYGYFDSVF